MKEFDLTSTPLTGVNLIEASAGTGKTYAIEGLFIRLILEKQLSVDQILVVTFTKAATEELKGRIRTKLIAVKEGFLKHQNQDDFIDFIVRNQKDRELSLQRIKDAITDFDKARIFTIHGFCQRILFEYAFEADSLFDMELLPDPSHLRQEVTDDFWRLILPDLSTEFVSYLNLKKSWGPEVFKNLFYTFEASGIRIVPKIEKPSLAILKQVRKRFTRIQKIWPSVKGHVEVLLISGNLNGKSYGSLKPDPKKPELLQRELKILSMSKGMDNFVGQDCFVFPLFNEFEKFTSTWIKKYTLKGKPAINHDFFELCDAFHKDVDQLKTVMEELLLYFKAKFLSSFSDMLSAKKNISGILFYEDLLLQVKKALNGANRQKLVNVIKNQYHAALVDEFQDTDPLQYDIFSQLFSSDESTLFLIGDPKQAIYGFRGADIFSYIRASADAESKYTLLKNWRSDAGLITAVNTIFSNVSAPFLFDEINFEKAKPAETNVTSDELPLICWFLKSGNEKKGIGKEDATRMAGQAVAREIAAILSETPRIFSEKDIAVIVRTNQQARIMKEHLFQANVVSVLYNAGNIYASKEAMELQRIMLALIEPDNRRLFRAALTTDIIGFSGEKINETNQENTTVEKLYGTFQEYAVLWRRYGFFYMFRLLVTREKAAERLLSFPDGERRLTNLLHLMEILHYEEAINKQGIKGLVKWLARQRVSQFSETEENLLRLESDEQAVTIVTIHKSKGLEYPVVFCPFAWDSSRIKTGKELLFHDTHKNRKTTLDLLPEQHPEHINMAEKELLSENLRLLYVALTRAKKRCYITWGRINSSETSAVSYLLADKFAENEVVDSHSNLLDVISRNMLEKRDDELYDKLKQIEKKSNGTFAVRPMPEDEPGKFVRKTNISGDLTYRKFSGEIKKDWKILSYSTLVSNRETDFNGSDYDRSFGTELSVAKPIITANDITEQPVVDDIFSFPKGLRTGIFFHDLFEDLDFTKKESAYLSEQVNKKLDAYGFDSNWADSVCKTLDNVISTPLPGHQAKPVLSSIHTLNRTNEMEFYFPLKPFSSQQLSEVFMNTDILFSENFPQQIERLSFKPSEGFMKGFIDLIFFYNNRYYIVDWKTNYLGEQIEAYSIDLLNRQMERSFYTLQYHIYVLALHQFLQTRFPDYNYSIHFGGVYYLFIRGINPTYGNKYGIFFDRPGLKTIDRLGKLLIPNYGNTSI